MDLRHRHVRSRIESRTDPHSQLKALYKGEASKNTGVTGKALALFLIPLDDRTPYEKLRNGEATFYEFDDNKRFREVLSKVIEISGSVESATPLDLKSNIAQALLKEVGLDSLLGSRKSSLRSCKNSKPC